MTVKDFLDNKNIKYPSLIIDDNFNSHTLYDLLNEYANLYSNNYLCYSEVIQMIDISDDLKELEIHINRKFKK